MAIVEKYRSSIAKLDLSKSPNDEENLIASLDHLYFLTIPFTKIIPRFDRLTINKKLPENNNSTINEINLLKSPPPHCINSYGRANLKNQSTLYGTFILPTLLLETNPDVGDLITISTWELKVKNTAIDVYPVFDFFKTKNMQLKAAFLNAIEKFPNDLKDLIIADCCIISSYFSKPVDIGKEINYTFSAHIADKIFYKMYDGKISVIIYPSVKDPSRSDNLAIKPDVFNEMFKLVEVKESLVLSKSPTHVLIKELKRTKNFKDLLISW